MKRVTRSIALITAFVMAFGVLAVFAPVSVLADQAGWQAVIDSDFVARRGPGYPSATANGILLSDRGTGEHDHNSGLAIDVMALRAASDGPGEIVVHISAPNAGAGHAMQTQGLAPNISPVIENGTAVLVLEADKGINIPGWLWGGWGNLDLPVICAQHSGQNWDFTVTSIEIDGVHIFEFVGLAAPAGAAAPVVADDATEATEATAEEATEEVVEDDATEEPTPAVVLAPAPAAPVTPVVPIAPIAATVTEVVTLRFAVDSASYTRNGIVQTMEAAAFNQDGRVMIPSSVVADAFGEDYAGAVVDVNGTDFVSLRAAAENVGGLPRWDGGANAAYVYVSFQAEAPVVAPPVVAPPVVAPPAVVDEATEEATEVVEEATEEEATEPTEEDASEVTEEATEEEAVAAPVGGGAWQAVVDAGLIVLDGDFDNVSAVATDDFIQVSTELNSQGIGANINAMRALGGEVVITFEIVGEFPSGVAGRHFHVRNQGNMDPGTGARAADDATAVLDLAGWNDHGNVLHLLNANWYPVGDAPHARTWRITSITVGGTSILDLV